MDDDERIRWNGVSLRRVAPVLKEDCVGCVYDHESSHACPKGRNDMKLCISREDPNDDNSKVIKDYIWIRDNDEAYAEYVFARLDPDEYIRLQEESDNWDSDG